MLLTNIARITFRIALAVGPAPTPLIAMASLVVRVASKTLAEPTKFGYENNIVSIALIQVSTMEISSPTSWNAMELMKHT